jgi:hypothetical protein
MLPKPMYPKFIKVELELLTVAIIVFQHRRLVLAVNSSSLASSFHQLRPNNPGTQARLQPPF